MAALKKARVMTKLVAATGPHTAVMGLTMMPRRGMATFAE